MPKKDPSAYVWLAASIRLDIDRLAEHTQRADELELSQLSAKIEDASIQLAQVYEQLIKLASPASGPHHSRHLAPQSERLPF